MIVGLLFLEHGHVQRAMSQPVCPTEDMCVQQQFFDRNFVTWYVGKYNFVTALKSYVLSTNIEIKPLETFFMSDKLPRVRLENDIE